MRIPVAVDDLMAVERGDQLIIRFSVPGMTTEGLAIDEYGGIDLRVGSEGVQPFDMDTWVAGAQPVPVEEGEIKARLQVETPVEPWVGREVLIGVRLANKKGRRWSGWSNLAAVHVTEPVEAPRGLRAEAVAKGVRLRWEGSGREGERHRIYRRYGDAEEFVFSGEADTTEWIDTNTEYGTSYEYRVQALVPAVDDVAESLLTEAVSVTPVDEFPPAVPEGLTAVAGFDSIELAWIAVSDEDLAGYEVRRSAGDDDKAVIPNLTSPAYSDRNVVSGKRYRYTVVAVDQNGNRSEPSSAADQTAP